MLAKKEIKMYMKELDKGSRFDEQAKTDKALETWMPVWKRIIEENRKMGKKTFYGCFPEDVVLYAKIAMIDWLDDVRMAFLNSGTSKAEERAEFYQVMVEEFGSDPEIDTMEYKKDMADFYYVQGKKVEGDALMEKILSEGSDIYTWADYARAQSNANDFEKAYQIYLRGIEDILKEKKVWEQQEHASFYQSYYFRDISLLYEGLEMMCLEMGKKEEAESWKETRQNYLAEYEEVDASFPQYEDEIKDDIFGLKQAPIVREEPKIGRNEPCPCGSGKKYKKCCLGKA